MISKAHRKLARRMTRLPMKTPISDSLLEILTLLFTEEEAEIVRQIPYLNATAAKVAQKVKRPVAEVNSILKDLAERALIFAYGDDNDPKYFVLPVMPGIFEASVPRAAQFDT